MASTADLMKILGVVMVTYNTVRDIPEYPFYSFFHVRGPPVIGDCSLTPENPDELPIARRSKYNFKCSATSREDDGPVKYNVFCRSTGSGDIKIHSDVYPDGTGITIPVRECDAYALVEHAYNLSSTKNLGKFSLEVPTNILPGKTTEQTLMNVLEKLKDVETYFHFTAIEKTIMLSNAAKMINDVLKKDSGAASQGTSSQVLRIVSEMFQNLASEPHDPLFESYFRKASGDILETADSLMQLQKIDPKMTKDDLASASLVVGQIHGTVTDVSRALLKRTNVGEIIDVSTPNIQVKVWRANREDTVGKKIQIQDMSLELPEGVGEEGVISMTAVYTKLNPEPLTPLEHATKYLNISFEGPGVEKQDFPIVYRFPRNTPVSEDEDSPYVLAFNLSGEAHCVKYDSTKKLYGWRVISDSAAMSVTIPSGGRAFLTVNSNSSMYLNNNIQRVDLLINNERVGEICWPVIDEVTFRNIKLTKSLTDGNEQELQVENGRPEKTRVGLSFLMAYSGMMMMEPPLRCNPSLSRKGKPVYPVSTSFRLLQMLGQCLKYDEKLRKFVHDKRCKVFPEKDSIRCECVGASIHTSVDPPVTNNIDFTELNINLQENPLPFIFSVTTCCLFLLLCFLGALQDIRSKRKLEPLFDAANAEQPIKYNVFIYISKFRCTRGRRKAKFSVTVRGKTGASATNTFISPGVSHGAMLHLLHHSDQQLGTISRVVLTPQHKSIKWHVSRVVVSDAVEKEIAVFHFNCWVKGEAKSGNRMSEAERNTWRENFFAKVTSDIMEAIPVLMLLLSGRVQQRKLDHMLTYALSLMIWALLHLWFYETRHPLFRPDDCIQGSLSGTQAALNSFARLLINMVLVALSSILIIGTINVSLMYKETKSEQSRKYRARGLLPLPHWVRLVVRVLASMAVVITISFLTLMAYMFSKSEFNTWLIDMGEAFAFQIATKGLGKLVSCAARYLLYLPNPNKFNEEMVNPEGMMVLCPECKVCPYALHRHFASHLSLVPVRRDGWLFGTTSSTLFRDANRFPI